MATYDLAYPGAAIDAILNTAYYLQEAGYIFRGSASDYAGTPSKREWVIAPAGFTGYGISSPVPQGSIGICLYNGTSWVGKIINVLTLDSEPTRNSHNGVTSGGVAATLDAITRGIMETFASLLFDDETAAADLSTKLSYAVKFSVSDVYQTVTHLNILAATTSKAGLLSAADKVKIDSFLTNLRSLTFADTTASADQGTQITETLKATIGGVQEVIDSITILAATSSKAGLLSASDKAYIDALPAALTSLSNSISAALALMESLVGYYVCDTAAATAAKTVAATGYSLTNGGCIRIKMTNANTAANVTLNINSTGAKALYYDGTQASSTNTWEAGEVLEVYYDGTQYQCASGGGGKFATGENVKDVSLLNALDGSGNIPKSSAIVSYLSPLMVSETAVDVQYNTVITGVQIENGKWISQSQRSLYLIPYTYTEGDYLRIKAGNTSPSGSLYAFLTSNDHTVGHDVPFCDPNETEWTQVMPDVQVDVPIPSTCTYIAINKSYQGTSLISFLPSVLQIITQGILNAQEVVDDVNDLEALVGNLDNVPIPNSPNLVKSGGVFSAISITEEQEVPLSSSDYSNVKYDASGSTAVSNTRISTSEYLTSGNGGDLIHNAIPSTYKVFIWIRESASTLVQFGDGDGWTTEDIQIPPQTDYFITIARLNNASIATSAYYAVEVVRSNLVNGIEKLQEEIEDINEEIEYEDLPELTQNDYDNIVYNTSGQTSSSRTRISTKNYYSTGYNSHVLHLTYEDYKLFVWYRISADEFVIGTDWTTEDFIVPPHTDYYITIAHVSNGNISTTGYFLVARHLLEKSRIINMEDRLEELENAVSPDTPQIVFSQWNVGQFAGGAGSPNITAATYNKMVIKWNKEVFAENADVFGMVEYNPVFGKNASNVDVSPDDVVWNDYQFKAIFRQPQTASYWGGNAILSKIQLENQEKIKYSCYNGITAPDATTQHMIDEVAFMTVTDMIYMGVKIKVVEASVAYNATTRSDNTYQRMAYQELVTRFANEPFVIIAGDMECVNRADYEIFTDAGFTLCNGGDFGWFNTCVTPLVSGVTELDNIIVKGFDVKDVKVSLSGLSDHYPLIATLEIEEPS